MNVELEPAAAFEAVVAELATALARLGVELEPRAGGRVQEGGRDVGRVVTWEPGEQVLLEWLPVAWQPEEGTNVELRFEPVPGGTRLTLEHRGLGALLGDRGGELAGWFAGEVAAPLVRAAGPAALGDWITDRSARRPSGPQARAVYRDPVYHRPNFRVLLDELALTADDRLLEVGCGGGAFLEQALQSGCRAAAVDHSPEMVLLAREVNSTAVAEGRLEVRDASAERLPFADGTFTCAAMTGVLGFLPDPVAALAEIGRVLAPDGRLVVMGNPPELRGTLAAPEPFASRLRFYDDEELAALGRDAGLAGVRVVRRDLGPHAREAGVPEEHLGLFEGAPSPFLLARRE